MDNLLEINVNDLFLIAIKFLTRTIDAKDKYTMGHSDRVRLYSLLLAERMMLPKDKMSSIFLASQLHDIGKARVSEAILKKKSTLTQMESIEMRKHVIYAQTVLGHHPALKQINKIIRYHHERIDGSGYPEGLRGDDIPFESRLIAVCDSFDAMTSFREYSKKHTFPEAVKELEEGSGILYDAGCVKCFKSLFEDGSIEYAAGVHYLSGYIDNAWEKGVLFLREAEKRFEDPVRKFEAELKVLETFNKMKLLEKSRRSIKRLENLSSGYLIPINDKFLNEQGLYFYYLHDYGTTVNICEMILSDPKINRMEKARAYRHLAMSLWKSNKKESAMIEMSNAEEIYKEMIVELRIKKSDANLIYFDEIEKDNMAFEEINISLSKLYDSHARIQYELGNFKKSLSLFEQSLEIKMDMSDVYGMSLSYGGRGKVYTSMGEFKKAENDFEQALRISRKLNIRIGIQLAELELVRNCTKLGQLGTANRILKKYERENRLEENYYIAATELFIKEKKIRKSKASLKELSTLRLKDYRNKVEIKYYEACIKQLENDIPSALTLLEEAVAMAQECRIVNREVEMRRELMLWYREGDELQKAALQENYLKIFEKNLGRFGI